MADGLIVIEMNGEVTYINKAFEKILGYKEDDVIGRDFSEMIPNLTKGVYKEKLLDAYKDTLKGKTIPSGIIELTREDGSKISTSFSQSFIKNLEGKEIAIVVLIRDITELEQSKERLNLFINSATDRFIYLDSELRFVKANKLIEKITGLSEEEMIGKRLVEISPDVEKKGRIREYKKVMKTGTPFFMEDFIPHPKFGDLIFDLKAFKVGDGLGIIISDITEAKKREKQLQDAMSKLSKSTKDLNTALNDTEEARDKIDTIIKSVADGIMVTDIYHRVILTNKAAEDILKVRFSNIFNRPIDFAIKENTLREKIKNTLNSHAPLYKFDFLLKDKEKNSPRIIRATMSPILDKKQEFIGTVTTLHDVTEEREVDRMKTEFISTAAHELRTPLTTIQGFSEILITKKNLKSEEKERYLSYITNQSKALAKIIGDLLDISRIESGEGLVLNRVKCDAGDGIRNCVPYFESLSKKHRFETDLPKKKLTLFVDKQKMEQVLKNIVGNAIKFSPNGGVIRFTGKILKDGYQVSVTDQGVGMTTEQVNRIFEKFYRVNPHSNIPGTGLGMSIVKNIIDAHQGRIWINSKLGEGTTVSFFLPKSSGLEIK